MNQILYALKFEFFLGGEDAVKRSHSRFFIYYFVFVLA